MSVADARRGEALFTQIAGVRLDPRMRQLVCGEMARLCKALFTHFAGVWLDPRVRPLVYDEIVRLCEALFTHFAGVLLDAIVYIFNVPFEAVLPREALMTMLAVVPRTVHWPHCRVALSSNQHAKCSLGK